MSSVLKANRIIISGKTNAFQQYMLFSGYIRIYCVMIWLNGIFEWNQLYDSSERVWNSCVAVMTLMLCFIKLMKTALKCIALRITPQKVVRSGCRPTTGGIYWSDRKAMPWNLRGPELWMSWVSVMYKWNWISIYVWVYSCLH